MKTKFLLFLVIILLSVMAFVVPSGIAQQVTSSQEADNKMGLEAKAVEADFITVREYLVFLRANTSQKNADELYSDALENQIVRTSEDRQDDYEIAPGVNDNDLMLGLTSSEIKAYFNWTGISLGAKASPLMMFGGDIEEPEKKSEPNIASHGEDSRLIPSTGTSLSTASRATTPVSLKEANDGANSVLENRSPVGQVIHQQTLSDITPMQKELRVSQSSSTLMGERVSQKTTNLLGQIRSCQTKVALDRNHGMEIPTALSSSSGSVFKSTASIGMPSSEHEVTGDFFGASLTEEKKDAAATALLSGKQYPPPTTPFEEDSLSDHSQISSTVKQVNRVQGDEGTTTPESSDSDRSTPEKNPEGSKDVQTLTQHIKTAVISATGFSDAADEVNININRALSAAAVIKTTFQEAHIKFAQERSSPSTTKAAQAAIWKEVYPTIRAAAEEALAAARAIPFDSLRAVEVIQVATEEISKSALAAFFMNEEENSTDLDFDIAVAVDGAAGLTNEASKVLTLAPSKIGRALVKAKANRAFKISNEADDYHGRISNSISAFRAANPYLSRKAFLESPLGRESHVALAKAKELDDAYEEAKKAIPIADPVEAKKAAMSYALEMAQESMAAEDKLIRYLSLSPTERLTFDLPH